MTGQPKKQVRTLNIVCCEKENPQYLIALGVKQRLNLIDVFLISLIFN
ncbi:Uncharacterised protein [Vibrio cholerae]|nr:Uncharacterised protein [Vibrio cholerae]